MSAELGATDAWETVIADLRTQRDKIDQAIQLLQTIRSANAALAGLPPMITTPQVSQNDSPPAITPSATGSGVQEGDLLGMTIADAAIKVLTARRKVMGNTELLAEFRRGGLILTSNDQMNVVNSVLTRRFNQVGDVVRVDRGQWGLQQWYPNRSFKKKAAGKSEEVEAAATRFAHVGFSNRATPPGGDPIAPEQPSMPPESAPGAFE